MAINPPLVLPFTFTNGTVADATQVNANFAALTAAANSNTRALMSADTTFYVATTGSDTAGNGLAITSPAATIQFIVHLLQTNYDLNGHNATIQLANGSYNQTTTLSGLILGQQTPSQLTVMGNIPSPGLVTIDGDPCFNLGNGGAMKVTGVTLQSSSSQCAISQYSGNFAFSGVIFGNAVANHLVAVRTGTIQSTGNYTISGNAIHHLKTNGGQIFIEQPPGDYTTAPIGIPTVTLTGTPAFSGAFASSQDTGLIRVLAAFSGSATGSRYDANNGTIQTLGQGASYLPGNSAGTVTNGGQYL